MIVLQSKGAIHQPIFNILSLPTNGNLSTTNDLSGEITQGDLPFGTLNSTLYYIPHPYDYGNTYHFTYTVCHSVEIAVCSPAATVTLGPIVFVDTPPVSFDSEGEAVEDVNSRIPKNTSRVQFAYLKSNYIPRT